MHIGTAVVVFQRKRGVVWPVAQRAVERRRVFRRHMLRIYPVNHKVGRYTTRTGATYRVVSRLAHKAPIAARAERVPRARAAHVLEERLLGVEVPVVALGAHWHDNPADCAGTGVAAQGARGSGHQGEMAAAAAATAAVKWGAHARASCFRRVWEHALACPLCLWGANPRIAFSGASMRRRGTITAAASVIEPSQ